MARLLFRFHALEDRKRNLVQPVAGIALGEFGFESFLLFLRMSQLMQQLDRLLMTLFSYNEYFSIGIIHGFILTKAT